MLTRAQEECLWERPRACPSRCPSRACSGVCLERVAERVAKRVLDTEGVHESVSEFPSGSKHSTRAPSLDSVLTFGRRREKTENGSH